MQYSLEPFNLFKKLTPTAIKKPLWYEVLKVIAKPLEALNAVFTELVDRTRTELKYNGQVICIEEILNLIFPGQLPIFITDNTDELPFHYIYLKAENNTDNIYIYPSLFVLPEIEQVYIYTENEYSSIDDFFVHVPQPTFDQIQSDGALPRFKSIIDKRKIAGKKYSIIVY